MIKKQLLKRKKTLAACLLTALVSAGITAAAMTVLKSDEPTPPVHNSATIYPEFKESKEYSLADQGHFECSRPIKLKAQTTPVQGLEPVYIPVDEAEAKLLCHSEVSGAEYKGKLEVLKKPEVVSFISKYAYEDLSIKALEFKYIQDKEFVHRLLPSFNDKEIGCIIVLYTPGGDRVFVEDEGLEVIEEFDYQTFASHLSRVSPADQKLFYDNLN